ncbi:MAG: prepilin-type N-terminal cleavage/methylation domain-containing protein [Arenicella sp.]|jgi:prepilin-type N-terminal cleavage/methylation domain-containing protein
MLIHFTDKTDRGNNAKSAVGFTLIEILLVMSLLGIMAAMLPFALNGLLSRTQHQVRVQSILSAVQNCELKVQQQQRSLQLGSSSCPFLSELSSDLLAYNEFSSLPFFNADGTASHSFSIRLPSRDDNQDITNIVNIDKLTGRASISTNE